MNGIRVKPVQTANDATNRRGAPIGVQTVGFRHIGMWLERSISSVARYLALWERSARLFSQSIVTRFDRGSVAAPTRASQQWLWLAMSKKLRGFSPSRVSQSI